MKRLFRTSQSKSSETTERAYVELARPADQSSPSPKIINGDAHEIALGEDTLIAIRPLLDCLVAACVRGDMALAQETAKRLGSSDLAKLLGDGLQLGLPLERARLVVSLGRASRGRPHINLWDVEGEISDIRDRINDLRKDGKSLEEAKTQVAADLHRSYSHVSKRWSGRV